MAESTAAEQHRRRVLFWKIIGVAVAVIVAVALLRWGGLHWYYLFWFRAFIDGAWEVYDYSIDRVRGAAAVLAALSPFLLGWIAYRTYQNTLKTTQSERWWRRAEWALDASTDESSTARRHIGKKVLARLKQMEMAPEDERELVEDVTTEATMSTLLEQLNEDPTTDPGGQSSAAPAETTGRVQRATERERTAPAEGDMDEPTGPGR